MVVALTVGLSVASRSITNLRTTTEQEQSQRAFSAAEAGIERVLKTGLSIDAPVELDNKAKIQQVSVGQLSGTEFLLNGGNPVVKDEGIDVWLVSHNPDGTLDYSSRLSPNFFTVYWGSVSDVCNSSPSVNTMAAVEIIVISGPSASSATTKRYVYDPCSSRRSGNNFKNPDTSRVKTIGGKTLPYNTHVASNNRIIVSDGLVVRVIPLYASTPIAVFMCNPGQGQETQNCAPLPSQGVKIESTGVSGETRRKISVFQAYERLSNEFFQYILFSP